MKSLIQYINESLRISSKDEYINESSDHQGYKAAIKAQNSFATKWWKNRNDEEFQKLTDYCKKVFGNNIYSPYEEHEKALMNYISKSKENYQEFDNVFEEIIDKYFNGNAQVNILRAYSLSSNKNDLFVQIVVYSLRRIDEKHKKNLLSE